MTLLLLIILIAVCVFGVTVAAAPNDVPLLPVISAALTSATIVGLILYLIIPTETTL